MTEKIFGTKIKMARVFDEGGSPIPVTLLKVAQPDNFMPGENITISGKTKGKGFAGVMKRWGFKGGPRTHGQSDRQRSPGAIGGGSADPGRVWPGKKMPGRMGGNQATFKGMEVVEVDADAGVIKVKGSVPGNPGNEIEIRK